MNENPRRRPFSLRRAPLLAIVGLSAAAVVLSACAPPAPSAEGSSAPNTIERPPLAPDETSEGFDLDALIEAAKKEGPITIYDETGRVVQIAEAFTEEYGIPATGVKIEANIVEKVLQEYNSGNVIGDVVGHAEVPTVYADLLVSGALTNWVPGDLVDTLPESARYPMLAYHYEMLWAYNSQANPDGCPVSNVWELTEPAWAGKIAMADPELRTTTAMWWNQAATNHAQDYADAYEEFFGEPLETDQPTAFHEWLSRLAGNNPVLVKNEEEASAVVGPRGQADPPMAFVAGPKFRNNDDLDYAMAACEGLQPFAGSIQAATMAYASKTKSPNAAKLYIYFATHQAGMDIIAADGKVSYSSAIDQPADVHGLIAMEEEFQPFYSENLQDDYLQTGPWYDFWRSARRG